MFNLKHLPNQLPDEHVIYFLRRHPITNLGLLLSLIFLLASPYAVFWYLGHFQPLLLENEQTRTLILLGGSIFFLYAWLFLFQNYMDYYLDMWIVTNRRILDVEQTGLFSRTASELRLYRIQDVTATVTGAIHTVFDYGDVEIQTAGEQEHFVFEQIPHPNQVAKAILELSENDRQGHLDTAMEEFAAAEKAHEIGKITEP